MKEHPITFRDDMIRAILAGKKTQTRRLKKIAESGDVLWVHVFERFVQPS